MQVLKVTMTTTSNPKGPFLSKLPFYLKVCTKLSLSHLMTKFRPALEQNLIKSLLISGNVVAIIKALKLLEIATLWVLETS